MFFKKRTIKLNVSFSSEPLSTSHYTTSFYDHRMLPENFKICNIFLEKKTIFNTFMVSFR